MRLVPRLLVPSLLLLALLLLATPSWATNEPLSAIGSDATLASQPPTLNPDGIPIPPLPILGNQTMIVIVCKYQDTDDPAISSEAWAEALNQAGNDFLQAATEGKTTFNFVPVPGICEFPYPYNDVVDDQLVRVGETYDAINFAEATSPNIFLTGQRLVIFVNRDKRAVASPQIYPHTSTNGFDLLLSMSLVPEPTAEGRTEITDGDLAVTMHELSHQLGLGDLYRYYDDGTQPTLTEFWGMMAFENFQNYTGFSRHATGWLPSSQQAVIRKPVIGSINQNVVINPPTTTNGNGVELLRLELDPTGLDLLPGGYLVEARPKIGLDRTITDTSILSGPLPSGETVDTRWGNFRGLPPEYEGGVLISKATDFLPAFTLIAQPLTSFNILEVQPRELTEPITPSNTIQLSQAAFQVGDSFRDEENDLTITVEEARGANGSFVVNVKWDGLPIPDVSAADIWLDNPTNGFGTFMTQVNSGIPVLFGDPVAFEATVQWQNGVPIPTLSRVEHRLFVRARNSGTVTAANVRGTVYIFDPLLVASTILQDPTDIGVVLGALAFDTRAVNFGNIGANAAVTRQINYTPAGPFIAGLVVDPVPNEFTPLNNFWIEPFIVPSISPGSPYPPIRLEIPIANRDTRRHVFIPTVNPLPAGWRYTLTPEYAVLEPGQREVFKLTVQPPDSRQAPPPLLQEISVLAWMDVEHSFVPVDRLSTYAMLTHPTRLTLTRVGVGALAGTLTYRTPAGVNTPIPNARVVVRVSGANGTSSTLPITTNAQGSFQVAVPSTTNVRFSAVANYGGTLAFRPVSSPSFFWEETAAPTIVSISPTSITAGSRSFQLTVTGRNFIPASVVRLGIVSLPTTFVSSTQLRATVNASAVGSAGTLQLSVQNGTTSTVSAPRLFPINPVVVGESNVTPQVGSSLPGVETTWVISWTHPSEGWRALAHLDFRLAQGDEVPLWVRFDEAQEGGADASTFSLLDAEGNVVGTGTEGSDGTVETETAILHLARSRHQSEPGSATVNITVAATLKPSATGQAYNMEVYEREDGGTEQGPDIVGSWKIGYYFLHLPLVSR